MKTLLSSAVLSLLLASFLGCSRPTSPQGEKGEALSFQKFVELESSIRTGFAEAQTSDCGKDCQSLRQEFRYVVYVGQKIYCYWDEKKAETGTDFDALARELEASIRDGVTPTQYFQVLRRWAAAFHDGHVNAMYKADMSDLEVFSAPIRMEVLAPATDREKVIVSGLSEGAAGLKVGDEVIEVNGKPIRQALDEAEKTVAGSTPRMRRLSAYRRIVDAMGIEAGAQPLSLKVARNGETLNVELLRKAALFAKPKEGKSDAAEEDDTGIDNFRATILPGNVGYLKIDVFGGSQSTFLLEQAMQRLSKTQGLLIDIRKNGGGDQSGNAVLSHLIQKTITRYATSARMDGFILSQRPSDFVFFPWDGSGQFSEWVDSRVKPAENFTYTRPVVALTSPFCFSACDTFASALKVNGLATIVGEATGGGTGSPLIFDLPVSENQFRYSVRRGRTAKGDPIEGVGTAPDILIEPTVEERLVGQDHQLAKALLVLQGKSTESSEEMRVALRAVSVLPKAQDLTMDISATEEEHRSLRKIAPSDELN